jgi:acyl carrier protein
LLDNAQRGVLKPKRVFTMKPTKEELPDIIYRSLDEVNEQLPNDQRIQKSPDTILVGRGGGLDSLGFVNFIALVEEKCAHKCGISLSLVDTFSHEDDALVGLVFWSMVGLKSHESESQGSKEWNPLD